MFSVGSYIKSSLLFFFLGLSTLNASWIESKYPSYGYVFNEFDVDESYIYDDDFVSFVMKNEKKLKRFYQHSLIRGKEILPTMQGLLVEDGVSDLFIYLAMVESGFTTDAVSPKKAVGLWQFMAATAKHYDLIVCNSYDERCDTVSATSAAISYLNKLHKQFGKWYLAAMAYNCGEGCMERAIRKAGTDDLSILTDNNLKYLPRETRAYIKKLLLVSMIGENVTLDFGRDIHEGLEDTLIRVDVSGGTSLKQISKLLKMEEKRLFNLNKSLKNGLVPNEKAIYEITIPIEKVYAFYLRYELPKKKKAEKKIDQKILNLKSHMISHYVALGETLESIAKLYHADSKEIILTNHLKNDFLILHSLLVIPVSQKIFEEMSQQIDVL
ncbi:MAG: lytic transglycosylase [Epsilonproteobacteria bacterium]|nr:MAG: lytic transglycosylase [Campylobacterota bacterium]